VEALRIKPAVDELRSGQSERLRIPDHVTDDSQEDNRNIDRLGLEKEDGVQDTSEPRKPKTYFHTSVMFTLSNPQAHVTNAAFVQTQTQLNLNSGLLTVSTILYAVEPKLGNLTRNNQLLSRSPERPLLAR
jgi:hypothetical protein